MFRGARCHRGDEGVLVTRYRSRKQVIDRPHFPGLQRGHLALLFGALVIGAWAVAAGAEEVVTPPPLGEEAAREVPAAGGAGLRRGPTSLRDIFGDDLDGSAVLTHPEEEGFFSARLPSFLAPDSVRLRSAAGAAPAGAGRSAGYSLGENLRASFNYNHARAFPMASSQALREHRFLDFSTGRDRDVLGLSMAWSWQNSTLGFGYRLESSRGGDFGEGRTLSSVVAGKGVDHALTVGITRRWGGADADE
jgi:hypothetical protein